MFPSVWLPHGLLKNTWDIKSPSLGVKTAPSTAATCWNISKQHGTDNTPAGSDLPHRMWWVGITQDASAVECMFLFRLTSNLSWSLHTFSFTFRTLSPNWFTVIHTYIHTLMVAAAMEDANQHIRSSFGVQYLAQGHFDMQTRHVPPPTPVYFHTIFFISFNIFSFINIQLNINKISNLKNKKYKKYIHAVVTGVSISI